MRLHSLPEARRYATNKADSDLLLARQNAVIDHLVPEGTPITWVWNSIESDCHIFKSFKLTPLRMIRAADNDVAYESWLMADH